MKQRSAILLKVCLVLMGAAVLGFCGILPLMMGIGKEAQGSMGNLRYPVLLGVYGCAAAFIIALYQCFKLLGNIANNNTFSEPSAKALKNIGFCASVACGILVIGGLPFFYHIAQLEDAPGVVIIGIMIALVPFAIAVFTSILQMVFREAIQLRLESEKREALPQ